METLLLFGVTLTGLGLWPIGFGLLARLPVA